MAEKTITPDKSPAQLDGVSERHDRQGAALRENLKKRKQQAQARKGPSQKPSKSPENATKSDMFSE